MVRAMHHRGPDDRGIFTDGVISLGMSRLSIIDLSAAAHQPMSNPEKTVWIVYNGETYNFQDERRFLEKKGYQFYSRSDTEVILRLYEQFGDDFLLRLRGMFSLAIYDTRKGPGHERLLLARDQLGIKPLVYTKVAGSLIFASEIKALLASGLIEPQIDPVSLRMLLTHGSIYQPRTVIQGVNMLLPAHRLVVEGNRECLERYWQLGLDRCEELRSEPHESLVEELCRALEESVRLQMVSDVPVGAFLSGGVDSSFIVGLMARACPGRVKTFSVGFGVEGASLDETDEAGRMAAFLGTDHTRVTLNGKDLFDHINHVVFGLDQPSVDGVNSYFISQIARRTVTVAISGTGGDELFAGYPWFAQMVLHSSRAGLNSRISRKSRFFTDIVHHPFLDRFVESRFGNWLQRMRNDDFLAYYANTYQIFTPLETKRLISRAIRKRAGTVYSADHDFRPIDELPGGPVVERVSALCLRGYTNNQLLRDIDAVSMAHSLEVRVPFLDVPLVDLALSLPLSAKLGKLTGLTTSPHIATYREMGSKRVLIDAGRRLDVLPCEIESQPKRGFTLPLDAWLRGPLYDIMAEMLSGPVAAARGLLDPNEVEQVRHDFCKRKTHWTKPWLLIVLELWCREVLDKTVRAES